MNGGVDDSLEQSPRSALLNLERYLPHRLDLVSNLVAEALAPVLAQFVLGTREWRILEILGTFGQMNCKQLGAHAGMNKSRVSRVVHDLVTRQLIEMRSDTADQRKSIVGLTADGQRLYKECSPLVINTAAQIEEAIEPNDREAFMRVLLRLTERAKRLASDIC